MTDRKWMCLTCMKEHDIVNGAVQCPMTRSKLQLTPEQIRAALDWSRDNPIQTSEPACTCRNSVFAMDIDRCPVHGVSG
jgi:hypothetical protein